MSYWTYIMGTIKVSPLGRTQAEKEYILKTVLDHLPFVTGSEEDMYIHVNQCGGFDSHSSDNEFGDECRYQKRRYSNNHAWGMAGWMETQSDYMITIEGHFRDRFLSETIKEFNKWLCRLAKRIMVIEMLVKITGEKSVLFNYGYDNPYYQMFEEPSWTGSGEHNWCEYLMWDRSSESLYPAKLERKYY